MRGGFFLKVSEILETNESFPYQCFDKPEKQHINHFPPDETCFNKLRNNKLRRKKILGHLKFSYWG